MEGYTSILVTAVALMLIIEGVLPFLLPAVWRDTFRRLTEMSDGQIRFVGLSSMLAGLLLLFLTKEPNMAALEIGQPPIADPDRNSSPANDHAQVAAS